MQFLKCYKSSLVPKQLKMFILFHLLLNFDYFVLLSNSFTKSLNHSECDLKLKFSSNFIERLSLKILDWYQ